MSDPFTRELAVIVDEMKSPKAHSRILATFAREQIQKTTIENSRTIGRQIPKPRVAVDGRPGVALGTVKPDGRIEATFNVETNAVRWVLHEIGMISPRKSGAYQRSHVVFADGAEVSAGAALPDAREYVIASDMPYAKKLDPKDGLPARSKQAPKGVYAAIAAVAAKRFDGEATIRLTFREIPLAKGGLVRNPAIIVRPA